MGRRKGKGTGAVALLALVALLLVPSALAGIYKGGTSQPGGKRVEILVKRGGPVQRASIEYIANCGRGGRLRGTIRVDHDDFNRVRNDVFADRFSGHIGDGRDRLFVRYSFNGKKRNNFSPFFGTFRLSARYDGHNPPKQGQCRTNLVRWTARASGGKG